MTKNNNAKLDDDRSTEYYNSNNDKILQVRNRRLVTRDGKHKSDTWTYLEGAYSIDDNNVTLYYTDEYHKGNGKYDNRSDREEEEK